MKILVIFTGGTIGSSVSDGWISTDSTASRLLMQKYKNSDITFCTAEPYCIHSENITAHHLNSLIDCVTENISAGYDGIIVTHGTDTLQFTAATLGFAVGNALPIAVVSANYPLNDHRSNGYDNFEAALALIRQGEKGIFVPYRNGDGVIYYHHASRLLRHGEVSDDLFSLNGAYGVYKDGLFEKNTDFKHTAFSDPVKQVTFCRDPGILNILCHPGNGYHYDLTHTRAILLQPYHSGTLPTSDSDFEAFCNEAAKRQIPVFLANFPHGVTYSGSKKLESLNVICPPLCAAVPLYMKLWLGVSLGADLKSFILTPLYEEFV